MTTIALLCGLSLLVGFVAGFVIGRNRKPPCFQCGEPAVGMLGSAPLCDRHYHEFRSPGQYPSAGEG
jgi:hypothetical protein